MLEYYHKQESVWVRWTGQPLNELQYPVNIASLWTEAQLNAVGLYQLVDVAPTLGKFDFVASTDIIDELGVPTKSYDVQSLSLADAKQMLTEEVEALREPKENAGFTLAGVLYPSDQNMQIKITGAVTDLQQRVDAGEIDPTKRWKTAAGRVDIDLATAVAIGQALSAHIQATFDREEALLTEIDAATTIAELEAIDINAGWPS